MGCLGGAQWVQEYVLEKNPELKIQVYAIWFSMIASDTPEAFPSARQVMPDRRVAHFWDGEKAAGRWFKEAVPSDYEGPVQWDVFYLYGADAEWGDQPTPLLTTGRPILKDRRKLAEAVAALPEGK